MITQQAGGQLLPLHSSVVNTGFHWLFTWNFCHMDDIHCPEPAVQKKSPMLASLLGPEISEALQGHSMGPRPRDGDTACSS